MKSVLSLLICLISTSRLKAQNDSYLIEITRDILGFRDEDGEPMVEKILDTAGQKGTGKWTGVAALDLGIPLTLIGEAVFSRCLSAIKDERVAASKIISGPTPKFTGDKGAFVEDLKKALYASKVVSRTDCLHFSLIFVVTRDQPMHQFLMSSF